MININDDVIDALVAERQQRVKSEWVSQTQPHNPGPVRLLVGRCLIRCGEIVGGRPDQQAVDLERQLMVSWNDQATSSR